MRLLWIWFIFASHGMSFITTMLTCFWKFIILHYVLTFKLLGIYFLVLSQISDHHFYWCYTALTKCSINNFLHFFPTRSIVNQKEFSSIGVTELLLSNGMKVCYKCTDFLDDQVLIYLFSGFSNLLHSILGADLIVLSSGWSLN